MESKKQGTNHENQTKKKVQIMCWYNYILLILWIVSGIWMFHFMKTDNVDGQVWLIPGFLIVGASFSFSVVYNLS